MQNINKPECPLPQDEETFFSAWCGAALDVNRTKAVLKLITHSMDGDDLRPQKTPNMAFLIQLAETHQSAIDAAIDLLERTAKFFDDYDLVAMRKAPSRGEISDACRQIVDDFKWAYDGHAELCPTADEMRPEYDPSEAARESFLAASDRRLEAEQALACYAPANLAELHLKISTICHYRRNENFPASRLDDVLASMLPALSDSRAFG